MKHDINIDKASTLRSEVEHLISDLSDPRKFMEVYKRLVILIRLKNSLLSRLRPEDFIIDDDDEDSSGFAEEVQNIQELEHKFIEKMHGYMENHQFIIQKQPDYFKKIMNVIE